MPVICPYCDNTLSIKVKGAKPGRYTTACPKCSRKFKLTIPDNPEEPARVAAITSERGKHFTMPSPGEPEAAPAPSGLEPPAADPLATAPLPRTEADPSGGEPDATSALPATAAATRAPDVEASLAAASRRASGTPSRLGGYQIGRELGHGGMGAVYLARQISLDRDVALKVMKPEWARNATFVARFTREAYAAAQLNHHNIVQIYDFGEDSGTAYFSMEFVEGSTLASLLRDKKRLDPEEAAGYVLQAARGLKYAHDQSMIHRDVKPDNLLLNAQGVVKVADLGLVKTPEFAEAEARAEGGDKRAPTAKSPVDAPTRPSAAGWAEVTGSSQITLANAAMGTPAFMAPEQARDAASVDARADIYSLGCTLYHLVTGRPPFEGRTALEVITKHQTEPIPSPDLVAKRVPKALSSIILRMTAKKPEDRPRDLGEVIRDLEEYLGINSTGPFTPREEHASRLEASALAFLAAPSARIRAKIIPGIMAACLILTMIFALMRQPYSAVSLLGFGLLTALADFVVTGVRRGTHLFSKARELVFTSPLGDWLMGLAGVAVIVAILYVFQLFWVWVVIGAVALGVAIVLNVTLDRRADAERAPALDDAEALLRSMRLLGLEEDAVRQFVCKYAGEHWEEFFEALFGYPAKLEARALWGRGDRARPRPKFAAWRDPLVNWIDAKVCSRREAKERSKLEKIEEKGLQAQGENLLTARRKARRAAEAMVAMAAEVQHAQAATRRDRTIPVNHAIADAMREAARRPEKVLVDRESGLLEEGRRFHPIEFLLHAALGPKTRFLAGAALVGACLTWMHQNDMISHKEFQQVYEAAKVGDAKAIQAQAEAKLAEAQRRARRPSKPIELPLGVVPKPWLALLSSFGAGAAGLFLIASSFFSGTRIALFAIPAAAVTLIGPKLGLPTFGKIDPSLMPSVAGLAILAAGILFGRGRT